MFGDKPRGGSRGGKDRFNWDDVKNDEHRCASAEPPPAAAAALRARGHGLSARPRRENYLGHSLHGQIGRWTTTARGSDLTWWSEGRSQLCLLYTSPSPRDRG